MTLALPFDNSYARLPARLFTPQPPTPVARPGLIAVNEALAARLGLSVEDLTSRDGTEMLAGNLVPEGAAPLAAAYAGHQFGGWNPSLGDGRAVLLGEIRTGDARFDIQLKGAGRTPYSRGGDGRAWLGPVLREYLVSEAMAALSIPTTRALAAVTTGEDVLRETPLPGAVLTRVASSHIRVGTFQYFAARGDTEALGALVDHVIARHYPQAGDVWGLLDAVIDAQARLIASWMGVGFIHGVMNTDNMSVAGETIDYGPCAFMDAYHPDQKYSFIDRQGRYAYARQPDIGAWNLAQFASALLPVMGERDSAIARATEMIEGFAPRFGDAYLAVFRRKLGLTEPRAGDADLVSGLLDRMAAGRADFTLTFRGLSEDAARGRFDDPRAFDQWAELWQARRAGEAVAPGEQVDLMRAVNPAIIPRNHLVEQMIASAVEGDYAMFHAFHAALRTPHTAHPDFVAPPQEDEEVVATFCGT